MTAEGPESPTHGVLDGVRVVDLSRVLAGPYCTQLLGDHGAEVIKVEPPSGDGTRAWGPTYDDDISAYYAGLNRNKQHMSADLGTAEGRALVLRLIDGADVLVENFKPGTMERWGLGPERVLERCPRLVYCRVSAFGAEGQMGGLPGYDAVLQAYSGIMHLNGEQDGPPVRVPMPVADLTTGLLAFAGVLLALYDRVSSGRGQVVDVNLLAGALSLLHPAAANYFATGERPTRLGSAHPNIAPCEIFASPAGEIYVSAGTDRQFGLLCDFLGASDLACDPRFRTNADRLAHRADLNAELARLVAALEPDAHLARAMIAKGIPASVVRPVDEVLEDPDVDDMVTELGGVRMLGIPIRLGRTPGSVRTPPRALGADSHTVLAGLGLSDDEIAGLVDRRVVAGRTGRAKTA